MSVPFHPRGAWTALVTSFTPKGELDLEGFKRLVDFQISEGITGLVPAGTTGESPTLNWEEHNQVIELAVKAAKGTVGVLAGTGSNCTEEAIKATQHAKDAGVSGALLVDCYYNGPSTGELRSEYYEKILAEVSNLPIVPYVIPGRSATALGAEDLAILFRNNPKRVLAVKQATGDLDRMRKDRTLCGESLAIMSGDDDMTLVMMRDAQIGCSGVISVMTNIVPGAITQMVAAQAKGDVSKADSIAKAIAPLFKLVGCKATTKRTIPAGPNGEKAVTVDVEDRFRNPGPVKAMMAGLGMPVGPVRAPLGLMTKPAVDQCRAALKEVYAAAPELLKPINKAFGVDIEKRLKDDTVWAPLGR